MIQIIVRRDVMLARRKMRLRELAENVGITGQNLCLLTSGKVKGIRFDTFAAICATLDCQPGDVPKAVSPSTDQTPVRSQPVHESVVCHRSGDHDHIQSLARKLPRSLSDGVIDPRLLVAKRAAAQTVSNRRHTPICARTLSVIVPRTAIRPGPAIALNLAGAHRPKRPVNPRKPSRSHRAT